MCILVLSKFHFTHRNTVTHHAFVFINEKARNSWVEQFAESKKMAEGTIHNIHHIVVYVKNLLRLILEYNIVHGSMTSLLSYAASGPKLTFLYPMTLQLCRFGMQVSKHLQLTPHLVGSFLVIL